MRGAHAISQVELLRQPGRYDPPFPSPQAQRFRQLQTRPMVAGILHFWFAVFQGFSDQKITHFEKCSTHFPCKLRTSLLLYAMVG